MRHRFFQVSEGAGRRFLVVSYSVIAAIAAFWWVPDYFGAKHPIEPILGIGQLVVVWVLVLNEWPRMAPLQVFIRSPKRTHALAILGVLTALSLCGLAL